MLNCFFLNLTLKILFKIIAFKINFYGTSYGELFGCKSSITHAFYNFQFLLLNLNPLLYGYKIWHSFVTKSLITHHLYLTDFYTTVTNSTGLISNKTLLKKHSPKSSIVLFGLSGVQLRLTSTLQASTG